MMAGAQATLAYAVRGRAILKYHGELCLSLVGMAAVPALFALLVGDHGFAARAGLAVGALVAAGFVLARVPGPKELQSNEALVIVAFGYLLTALLMTWPLAGDGVPGIDAFFHALSAVTTTGLSTSGPVGARSPAFLFAQAWMQWYGGLVIVVLAVFLVGPGSAAKRLSENDGGTGDTLSGTRGRARQALLVYSALTAAGFLLLTVLGADEFDALLHVLAAVSTGGFSSHPDSLRGLHGWPLQAGVMAVGLAGAIALSRYWGLARGRSRSHDAGRGTPRAEVLTLLALCLAVTLLTGLSMSLAGGMPWREAVLNAPLLAVSAQTTAGFAPVEVGALDNASKLILIVSMLIGGDLGSTAGGIKIFRFLIIVRLVQLVLLRPALPAHAVAHIDLDRRRLDAGDLQNALGVVAAFGAVVLASWLAFLSYGHAPIDALFEVVSATATVGLSTGLAGPHLEPALKLVLCLNMWMGRLEVIAVLILFHPRTWIGRRAETR